jgi:hypothetical protein
MAAAGTLGIGCGFPPAFSMPLVFILRQYF